MPSTGTNRTNSSNLLRTVYQKNMRPQFSQKSILLQAFRRNERNYAPGLTISIPLHAASGEGPTFNNAGNLPPASREQIERATFDYSWLLDRIEITGDFMDDAASSVAAEESPLALETRSLVKRCRHDLNFFMYGDGSGIMANPASTSSATVMIVDDVRGLRNNMRIDVIRIDNGSVGTGGVSGATITVNRSTKTVTLTGGAQFADATGADVNANPTDYALYKSGSRDQAIFGLAAAISAGNPPAGRGNYGNIDRTLDANDFYRGVVQANSGVARAPTMKLMQDVIDEIDQYSEGETNLIVCGHQVWSHLSERMNSDRRYNGETSKLNGWATAIKFASVNAPIVRDKHCQPGSMYFLDTSTWVIFQNHEGKWVDEDGSVLKWVQGKVAFQAAWQRRLQPVCLSPIANGVLQDLEYVAAA